MNLYTIIMDFRGGTYISQVKAPHQDKAVEIWANELNTKEVLYFSDNSKKQLIEALPELIKDNEIIELDNLQNVWSFTYQFKTGYAIVNIVKTLN